MTEDSFFMIELRSIKAENKILLLNYLKILMHTSYLYRNVKL